MKLQSANVARSPRNFVWGKWVKDRRKACQMNRREVAYQAGVDPSYLTLIERDGFVPRDDKVASIGRVLGSEEEALLVCNRIPETQKGVIRDVLRGSVPFKSIPEDCMAFVKALCAAPLEQREQAMAVASALLNPKKQRGLRLVYPARETAAE